MQDRIKTIVQKAIKRLQGEVIGEEGDLVAGYGCRLTAGIPIANGLLSQLIQHRSSR